MFFIFFIFFGWGYFLFERFLAVGFVQMGIFSNQLFYVFVFVFVFGLPLSLSLSIKLVEASDSNSKRSPSRKRVF